MWLVSSSCVVLAVAVFCTTAVSRTYGYLPFLEVSDAVPQLFLDRELDRASDAVFFPPPGFPFANSRQHSSVHVVTNGFFSFGRPVVYYEPLLFPGGSQYEYLVAPFWADIDIEYNDGGEIFYQVQVHSKGNSSASDELLDEVSAFISSDQQTAFSGSWMLVATWDSVEMYEDENDYGNTFQGILITDGWRSYAVFTYKCGLLEWSGGATIGFYAEGDFYMNHPLSGVNSTQIACVNGDLLWSNVVYSLNGPLPFMDISADLKLPKFLNATSVSIQTGDLGFPIGNSTQNEVYVSTNGYFSFGRQITDCCPTPFPNGTNYLVAPFWADTDIRGDDGGEIYYQVHSRGNNSVSDELLDEVSVFVSNSQQTVFNGSWMLVATWDHVKAFPGNSTNETNTFQGTLVTNGEESYAVFTYQCDLMEWSGRATIGYYADGDLYENHPLTGSPNANEIACLGNSSSQPSQWTNVVYHVSYNGSEVPKANENTTVEEEPFLSFIAGNKLATVPSVGLPRAPSSHSEPIHIPVGLPFGSTTTVVHSVVYVGTNGLFSFGSVTPTKLDPVMFPGSVEYVVAPFWSHVDSQWRGEVHYEVYNRAVSVESDAVMDTVSAFISSSQVLQDNFTAEWMLVATWDKVYPFPDDCECTNGTTVVCLCSSDQEPNTFQGILLTDGRQSFAVFTYECGLLGWSTGAVVGFTGEGGFYGNHPLSVKGLVLESTSNIDCQSPYRWNNVIFNLSPLSNLNDVTLFQLKFVIIDQCTYWMCTRYEAINQTAEQGLISDWIQAGASILTDTVVQYDSDPSPSCPLLLSVETFEIKECKEAPTSTSTSPTAMPSVAPSVTTTLPPTSVTSQPVSSTLILVVACAVLGGIVLLLLVLLTATCFKCCKKKRSYSENIEMKNNELYDMPSTQRTQTRSALYDTLRHYDYARGNEMNIGRPGKTVEVMLPSTNKGASPTAAAEAVYTREPTAHNGQRNASGTNLCSDSPVQIDEDDAQHTHTYVNRMAHYTKH